MAYNVVHDFNAGSMHVSFICLQFVDHASFPEYLMRTQQPLEIPTMPHLSCYSNECASLVNCSPSGPLILLNMPLTGL